MSAWGPFRMSRREDSNQLDWLRALLKNDEGTEGVEIGGKDLRQLPLRGAIGTVCANFMFSAKSRIYLSPHLLLHNLYRLSNHQILSILAASYVSITLL